MQTVKEFLKDNTVGTILGSRVQIPVHYDAWMRGACYGKITVFQRGTHGQSDCFLVKLDKLPTGKRLRLWSIDWDYAHIMD